MSEFSRNKGAREEVSIVGSWQYAGFAAERVPLSGAMGGRFSGDVSIPILGLDRIFEAKIRATGFKEIYKWIDGNFGLFIRADRHPRLLVMRETDSHMLCQAAEAMKK